ncbi:MAG: hypothetical protein J6Y54_07565 [Lentisphaeria bacterium]|nr:hypothetical protein [Lentisphaeria bacterium]
MEERFDIADDGIVWGFPQRGKSVLELARGDGGAAFFRLGRVKCGKFGELSALPEKFRMHRAEDAGEAELESAGVIPFGCEYRVVRDCRVSCGCASLTTDVSAVTGGRVGDLELEPLSFCGEVTGAEFLIFGEEKFRKVEFPARGTIYSGSEVPLMLRATYADGLRCEMALGADVWRHRAAFGIPGAESEYELSAADGELKLTRRVLKYDPETEPERRPWRFTALIGWDDGKAVPAPDGEAFELPGCAMSAASRRALRSLVRRSDKSLNWRNADPAVCGEAAHVSRSGRGELAHFDLEELLTAWRWSNRQLGKCGAHLTLTPKPGGLFADSVIFKNLGRPAAKLDFELSRTRESN